MIASSDGARLVGYARVSTDGQDLALQIDALRNHGVANELIFTDKASAQSTTAKGSRPASANFARATFSWSGDSIASGDPYAT